MVHSNAAFRQASIKDNTAFRSVHKVPEKIISFKGREIDEMEDEDQEQKAEEESASTETPENYFQGYQDYYEDYKDLGEDYYLPQETLQVESERTVHKEKPRKIRKEADEFNWYLHHPNKQ